MFKTEQNRESTEGYSKSIVRRKITTSSEKDWSQQVEHEKAQDGVFVLYTEITAPTKPVVVDG